VAQIIIDFVAGFQNDAYCGLFGDVLMDSGFFNLEIGLTQLSHMLQMEIACECMQFFVDA
jgi:hypothetical protein